MATLSVAAPPSVRERYAGLLQGALAADALALAPHWIYDQDELARSFGRVTDLLAPPEGSYHVGKGRGAQTHYGDQTLVLMESLDACGGNFVMDDFARRWRTFWDQSKSYCDKATKQTLAHFAEERGLTTVGSDSLELGGAARIAPLLLALRNEDKPTVIGAVRAQTALTHATPQVMDAAEFIARTVFLLVQGVSIGSALPMAATHPYRMLPAEIYLRQANEVISLPTAAAILELGQSCPTAKALPAVFTILLQHGHDPETALIENVMAGGDSAARGMVLGLLLGAAHGRKAIPQRWVEPLLARPQIEAFLETVGLGCT